MLVSDCLAVYDDDDVTEVQHKCYAHHLRAIDEAMEKASTDEQAYLHQVALLLKTAIAVKAVKPEKPPDQYKQFCADLERWADDLILPFRSGAWEQRDHLFTFLYHDEVQATNNLAERMLRPAVISRKVSCGNRSDKGAETWQILMSLAATAHQRGENFQTITQKAIQLTTENP